MRGFSFSLGVFPRLHIRIPHTANADCSESLTLLKMHRGAFYTTQRWQELKRRIVQQVRGPALVTSEAATTHSRSCHMGGAVTARDFVSFRTTLNNELWISRWPL